MSSDRPTVINPLDNSYTTLNAPTVLTFMVGIEPIEKWVKPDKIPRKGDVVKIRGKYYVCGLSGYENAVEIKIPVHLSTV